MGESNADHIASDWTWMEYYNTGQSPNHLDYRANSYYYYKCYPSVDTSDTQKKDHFYKQPHAVEKWPLKYNIVILILIPSWARTST